MGAWHFEIIRHTAHAQVRWRRYAFELWREKIMVKFMMIGLRERENTNKNKINKQQ